jgi:hypothetical protein
MILGSFFKKLLCNLLFYSTFFQKDSNLCQFTTCIKFSIVSQKTVNSQVNTEQKEQYWRYYNIYTTEPQQQKQHGTGTKTDRKISGTG